MQVHKTQTRGREVSVQGKVHCVDQQKFVYFLKKKLVQCDYTLNNTEFYQKWPYTSNNNNNNNKVFIHQETKIHIFCYKKCKKFKKLKSKN